MIITRTPFRVSFCGGGSDIPDFYLEHGGCVLSTTINRYMYITIHPFFDERTSLKYSQNEIVNNADEIKHSILRCVLKEKNISGVEISSTADVPSGTGLGSSSSFTVGLLNTLACYQSKYYSKAKLAEEACRIEIEELKSPIGKQDQYAAAFGGLNFISFNTNDTVNVEPVITRKDTLQKLRNNLVMMYTGITHNANEILSEQKKNISQADKTRNLIRMCGLAREMKKSLENNSVDDVGRLLNEGWQMKRELSSGVSSPQIDEMYDCAIKNGALGGKLLGAGGGGFLLFYCPEEKQPELLSKLGLKAFPFEFEYNGTSVIYIGDKYWEGT